jgi:hypothetical protein
LPNYNVNLPTLHPDQIRAFRTLEDARGGPWAANRGGIRPGGRNALRCGRRWGKTDYAGTVASDRAGRGQEIGWFAPDYKRLSEAYEHIKWILKPIISKASKMEGVIRTVSGGRIDFWTLNDENAGRSRRYHGVILDEVAFTQNGPVTQPGSMLSIWEKAIEPTLLDFNGWCLATSNTNGDDPENFLAAICNEPKWGFVECHSPSITNPHVPLRLPGETDESHWARRLAVFDKLKEEKHPLVFQQEYLAEFINWSGVAFFDPNKWLINGLPVEAPKHCEYVYAIIDSATKTGTANDATGVTYYAYVRQGLSYKLSILDWDVQQIEGDLLIDWLPTVFQNLEAYARNCGARMGSIGALIEDKASGEILLKQAARRGLPAQKIDSRLTALGKDERAISVSGYHYREDIKISPVAFNKVVNLKGSTRNHFVAQVSSFRVGDKDAAKRADDLLDTYTYGVAVSLGDGGGF